MSGVLLLGCFVAIDVLVLGPGKGLYCYNTDVDLNSGILRKTFYYWLLPVKQEVISTKFSDMVASYVTEREPKWTEDVVTVSASGACVRKGGMIFSSCNALANAIDVADATGKLTADQKERYLIKALGLLRAEKVGDILTLADEVACLDD